MLKCNIQKKKKKNFFIFIGSVCKSHKVHARLETKKYNFFYINQKRKWKRLLHKLKLNSDQNVAENWKPKRSGENASITSTYNWSNCTSHHNIRLIWLMPSKNKTDRRQFCIFRWSYVVSIILIVSVALWIQGLLKC